VVASSVGSVLAAVRAFCARDGGGGGGGGGAGSGGGGGGGGGGNGSRGAPGAHGELLAAAATLVRHTLQDRDGPGGALAVAACLPDAAAVGTTALHAVASGGTADAGVVRAVLRGWRVLLGAAADGAGGGALTTAAAAVLLPPPRGVAVAGALLAAGVAAPELRSTRVAADALYALARLRVREWGELERAAPGEAPVGGAGGGGAPAAAPDFGGGGAPPPHRRPAPCPSAARAATPGGVHPATPPGAPPCGCRGSPLPPHVGGTPPLDAPAADRVRALLSAATWAAAELLAGHPLAAADRPAVAAALAGAAVGGRPRAFAAAVADVWRLARGEVGVDALRVYHEGR